MKQTGSQKGKEINMGKIAEAKRKQDSAINAQIKGASLQFAVQLNQGTGDIEKVKEHWAEFEKMMKESRKGSE